MSDLASPGTPAFLELETLVRHLADELASFRRRALLAEARLREVETPGAPDLRRELDERCAVLERENAAMRARLEGATGRTRLVLDRVRFLRQQSASGTGGR